ncbi:MAG: sulfotransferase [Bacteroidales bacterium]|nr:sulfotransferase [Bacteroidales bacterium]
MNKETLSATEIIQLPLFFIIGRPRTGTTLLRSLMDAHKNVIIPLEGPFMLKLYGKYHEVTLWTKEVINEFYDDLMIKNDMGFITMENWKVDKERLKNDLLSCVGENSFANICKVINGNFPCPKEKDPLILGDKNPVYSNKLKYILKLYPQAKFIILSRDYRDHIQSMHKVDFGQIIAPVLAYRWRKFIRESRKYMANHPNNFFYLRYEDLAMNPQKHLKELTDFLGIAYDESMLEFYKAKNARQERGHTETQEKYHQSLHNPISTKSIGNWKSKLKDIDVQMADAMVGPYAERAGYERKYKSTAFGLRLKLFPVFIYMWITEGIADVLAKKFNPQTASGIAARGPVLLMKYWNIVHKEETIRK